MRVQTRSQITRLWMFAAAILAFAATALPTSAWEPGTSPLKTRWARNVTPENAHPEYPRPQMVRQEWLNLNGLWDFALLAKDLPQPIKYQTQILVPFPVESALSGVMKPVSESQRLWYRRSFELPKSWSGRRVLLHFG